jgi:hypothetical protein
MSHKNQAIKAIMEIRTMLHELPEETMRQLIVDIKGKFRKATGKDGKVIYDYMQTWELYQKILNVWVMRICAKSNKSGFPIAQAALIELLSEKFQSHGNQPNTGDMLYYIITNESPEHFLENKRTLGPTYGINIHKSHK